MQDENSEILLAKVDATVNAELSERFKVRGYPTLKFFVNAQPIEYNGGRVADEIVNWLKKKTGPPAVTLETVDDLKKLREKNDVVVVGYFKSLENNEALVSFNEVAQASDSVVFAIASQQSLFDDAQLANDMIVLYKNFDEGRNDYSGEGDLKAFIQSNQLALVTEFNQEVSNLIQWVHECEIRKFILTFIFEFQVSTKDIRWWH